MNFSACFCGHANTSMDNKLILSNISNTVKELYEKEHITNFLSGGMGNFDTMCEREILLLKKSHPEVKLFLIIPYLTVSLNKNREELQARYDEIIYPDFGKEYHYKQVIVERNKWMVNNSDYVIANVTNNYGGAYRTLKYAKKMNKTVISVSGT